MHGGRGVHLQLKVCLSWQVTCPILFAPFDSNSQLLQRGLIRTSWLLYTEPSFGSRGRSANNVVAVRSNRDCPTSTRDARLFSLCLDLYSPFPSPFIYFPYAGLTYPILLDSRISLVAQPNAFLFCVDRLRFRQPVCAASATGQRHYMVEGGD